eukprot:scaffold1332_cov166-Amphora_coffeaeformis.AAC.16
MNEQPEFLLIKNFDSDRDVLVDYMEGTPERNIYRQVLNEWSTRYKFCKRGDKAKVVKHIIKDMKQKGVRFWVRDHSPAHFGVRVVMVPNKQKILDRVMRCIRDLNRRVFGASGSFKSQSGTESLAPSFSAASNGSTIRTKESIWPPVMQVNVPCETEAKAANTFPVPMEVMTNSARTLSSSDSTASMSSVHEISVASKNTKNTRAETSKKEPVVPAPPNLDQALSPPPPLPHLLAKHDSIFLPPNLERHTESWCSLIQHCYPELQALMNEDETNPTVEADFTATEATTTTQDDRSSTKRPRENEVLIDSGEESQDQASQRCRISNETQNSTSSTVETSTPIWVHMSRHLTVLEQRLELVEKDNLELRRRLAAYEDNYMTTDETNYLLYDQAISNFAHL